MRHCYLLYKDWIQICTDSMHSKNTQRMPAICVTGHIQSLTILATKSPRWSPYLATTGRRTSVTGFVGFAFNPTDLLMGTRSSLKITNGGFIYSLVATTAHICLVVFSTFMTYGALGEKRSCWYWRAFTTEYESQHNYIWVQICGSLNTWSLSWTFNWWPDSLCEREMIITKCTWTKCVSQDEVLGSWV